MVGESPSMDAALGMVQTCVEPAVRGSRRASPNTLCTSQLNLISNIHFFNLDSLPLDPQLLGP